MSALKRRLVVWRLRRQLRDMRERWNNTYYEGPEPPIRLIEDVLLFGMLHPSATVADWQQYVMRAVESAYRDGFARGHQWRERRWTIEGEQPPEQVAEQEAFQYSLVENHPRWNQILELGYDPYDPTRHWTPEARQQFRQLMLDMQWRPGTLTMQRDDE